MKRCIFPCILTAVEWLIFLPLDYVQEHYRSSEITGILLLSAMLILPVLCGILLCLPEKNAPKRAGFTADGKLLLTRGLTLAALTVISLFVIQILFNLDLIPQHQEGWEWFLNGIEYFMMPLCTGVIGCVILLLRWLGGLLLESLAARKRRNSGT